MAIFPVDKALKMAVVRHGDIKSIDDRRMMCGTYPSVIMDTCLIRTSRASLPLRQPILPMLHPEKRHAVKVGRKTFELWRSTYFLMCLTAEIR